MTALDPAAARARCNAASEAPWFVAEPPFIPSGAIPYVYAGSADPNAGRFVCDLDNMAGEAPSNARADAEFIAAARTGWPEALDVIEERDAEVAALRVALDRVIGLCDEQKAWCSDERRDVPTWVARVRAAATVPDPGEQR